MSARASAAAPPGPVGAGPGLEARGAVVRAGSATLLDGVDLALRPGQVHAVLGPNGAGKSTLLALLAGDRRPDAGAVLLDGAPLAGLPARVLARRRAVLLQQTEVAFAFTVQQVVAMGRAPWPPAADDADRVFAALAALELVELADRSVPSLSGGERARVAMARVLVQDAPILLLDEPTAALDLRHQEAVLRLARERAARGDAVAVVLHDLSLAAAYADRLTLLAAGRVVAAGTPAEVLRPALLAEVYRVPVEVLPHPGTGALIVQPERASWQGASR